MVSPLRRTGFNLFGFGFSLCYFKSGQVALRRFRVKNLSYLLLLAEIRRRVKPQNECLKSVRISQLRRKHLGGVRARHSAYTHAIEMAGGRIVILNKDRLV